MSQILAARKDGCRSEEGSAGGVKGAKRRWGEQTGRHGEWWVCGVWCVEGGDSMVTVSSAGQAGSRQWQWQRQTR